MWPHVPSRLCGRLNTCELAAENRAMSAILAKKSLLSRLWLVLWRSINMKNRPRSSPRRILPMSRSSLSTPSRSFTSSHRAFCRPHFPHDRDVHAWSSWLCLTCVVPDQDYRANFATSELKRRDGEGKQECLSNLKESKLTSSLTKEEIKRDRRWRCISLHVNVFISIKLSSLGWLYVLFLLDLETYEGHDVASWNRVYYYCTCLLAASLLPPYSWFKWDFTARKIIASWTDNSRWTFK